MAESENNLVCISCGQAKGHSWTCEGGGYASREQLRRDQVEQLESEEGRHFSSDSCLPGCRYCREYRERASK